MGKESIRLHTRDKRTIEAEAEVTRYSQGARIGRAAAVAVIGTGIGAATIVIPVAHLILPWLIPILSWVGAYFVYRTGAKVPEVHATCPDCDTEFRVEAGAWEDPLWIRCPECKLPLRVDIDDPAA